VPPPGERALPVVAGVLLALAYPPARLLVPALVGLVPLLVFIAERPAGPGGRWSATRAGALTGVVYFGAQLYWLAVALLPESPALAIPAYLLFVGVLAGFTAAFAWGLHYTLERLGLPLALLAALLWTTLEWTQGRLGDLAFPWLGLGHALAPFPRLAGAADLVGARGLTLWLAGINGLLAMAAVRHRAAGGVGAGGVGQGGVGQGGRATVARLGAAALLLFLVPAGYGFWRAATLELRPAARVAVIQPNIPQSIKRDHALALDTSLVMLTRLTRAVADHRGEGVDPVGEGVDRDGGDVDLVAWPEVALTADLAGDPALLGAVRDLSRGVGAPILAGAFGRDGGRDGGRDRGRDRGRDGGPDPDGLRVYNSAFLVSADDGVATERYDKRRMVAFIERVPLVGGGLERGRGGQVFRITAAEAGVEGASFGVLICFESAFADLARRYRRDGAGFLVNITNDGWFGRDPWYARTTALWQHPAHMTLRAIETRMGVARAANTGISMIIDPIGRVQQATELFVDDILVGTVVTTNVTTLFVRWGDWLATLAAFATATLLVGARVRPMALSAGNVGGARGGGRPDPG
jgi:apolipoprotein N-acyltransferase